MDEPTEQPKTERKYPGLSKKEYKALKKTKPAKVHQPIIPTPLLSTNEPNPAFDLEKQETLGKISENEEDRWPTV